MCKGWLTILIFFAWIGSSAAWEVSATSSKYDKDSLDLNTFIEEAHWANEDLMISTIGHGECTGDCSWDIRLDGDKLNLTHKFNPQKFPRGCGTALLRAPLYRSMIKVVNLKKDNYQIIFGNDSMKLNTNNTITDYCDQRANYDCYLRHFFQVYKERSPNAKEPRIEFGTPQEEKIVRQNPLFLTYFKEEMAKDVVVFKMTFNKDSRDIDVTEIKDDGRTTSGNLYEAHGRSFEGALKSYVWAHNRPVEAAKKVKVRLNLDVIEVFEDTSMKVLWNKEKIFYRDTGINFMDRPGSAIFYFYQNLPSIKKITKEEFLNAVELANTTDEIIQKIPNKAYPPESASIKKETKEAKVYVKLLPGENASERFIQVHNRTITVPKGKNFQIDLEKKTYKEVQ